MKRIVLLSVCALLVFSSLSFSQATGGLNTGNTNISILATFDFEQISVDNTGGGKGFTASKINPTVASGNAQRTRAQRADCVVETDQIRVTTNSATTVTSTVGTLLQVGASFTVFGYDDINNFRAIRVATTAQLDCHYSRLK